MKPVPNNVKLKTDYKDSYNHDKMQHSFEITLYV